MTWYTLASTAEDHNDLVLRFIPDTFITSSDRPVLVLSVQEVTDRQATLATLAKFGDSFIVEYTVTSTQFTAVSESDWEEWSISGRSVELVLQPYSADELIIIATSFSEMLQNETSYCFAQSRKIADIEHFVSDLIARADAKKSLSSRSSSMLESQIDVLTRVLNRIRDA